MGLTLVVVCEAELKAAEKEEWDRAVRSQSSSSRVRLNEKAGSGSIQSVW